MIVRTPNQTFLSLVHLSFFGSCIDCTCSWTYGTYTCMNDIKFVCNYWAYEFTGFEDQPKNVTVLQGHNVSWHSPLKPVSLCQGKRSLLNLAKLIPSARRKLMPLMEVNKGRNCTKSHFPMSLNQWKFGLKHLKLQFPHLRTSDHKRHSFLSKVVYCINIP